MCTRAAGVSPPWSVNRTRCGENRPPFDDDATDEQERRASARCGVCKPASAIAMRRISAFRVRIECTPRGAYAPRSSVAVRMSADEKAIFAMYKRMCTRAAGVSPPCVCKPASAIAMRRISAFRVRIECTPRGAYAPRSSVAVRMSADEKPIFAMYKRMPTRAAGVSPPWSVNRTRCGENRPPFDDDATDEQERRASARRVFGRSNDVRDFSQITCKCVPHITAGLRQPLLIAPRPFGAEYDIWDVQTHVHKSGGRQPAVVGKPNAVRRKSPTIRRRCDGRTRAAGVRSPPCDSCTRAAGVSPPCDSQNGRVG
jgi:hypothetical protein